MNTFEHQLTTLIQFFTELDSTIEWVNKGAEQSSLDHLELLIGHPLPDSYKTLYQRFDGSLQGIAFGWHFIPLERTINYFNPPLSKTCYYLDIDNQDQVKAQVSFLKRIPIIEDYGGSVIYIDLDPDTNGTYGQLVLVFRDYPDTIYSVAPDLEHFIELIVAEALQNHITLEDDEYLDFQCLHRQPSYTFWGTLSHKMRTIPLKLPENAGELLKRLPTPFRARIAEENYDFIRPEFGIEHLHFIRSVHFKPDDPEDYYTFLPLFPKLKHVSVYGIVPVSAFAFFNQLSSLELAVSTETWPLISQLISLTALNITDCEQIRSLAPLTALLNLQSLELHRGCGTDLSLLTNLPHLKSLSLSSSVHSASGNWIGWAVLSALRKLEILDVSMTNFDHLHTLAGLPNLIRLDIVGCSISNYLPLKYLPDGLHIHGTFDFFENAILTAPEKKFVFNSITGEGTPEQEALWYEYMGQLR